MADKECSYRTRMNKSLENPSQHFPSNADESTGARAIRELLRLKSKLSELTPRDSSDGRPLGTGDADCRMMVRGRGVVPEEAWQFVPVVDEAINSIMDLERRRQELVVACRREEVSIAELQSRLDDEEQRRLVVLPVAVQREHEAGLREVAELKWLVAFNQRQCDRLRNRLEDVAQADDELSRANNHYKEMVPSMQQKETDEEENIEEIKKQQKEVLCGLREAEAVQKDREELHAQTLRWAGQERGRLTAAHTAVQESRDQCRVQSAALLRELSGVDKSVAATQQEIAATEREGDQLDAESSSVVGRLSVWEGTISGLSEQRLSLQRELAEVQQANSGLTESLDSKVSTLDGDVSAVRGELKSLSKTFRDLRSVNEDLRQEGDELRERISLVCRQQRDTERGVVRACAEMKSLDDQVEVSTEVYSAACATHLALAEQLKSEQSRVKETELTWKATVEALATQQREECKTRTVYENKMAVDKEDLQEAEEDHRSKVAKIMKLLETSVEKAEVQEAKTKMAEEEHTRWLDMVGAKETQLLGIRETVEQLETGLEQVRKDILPQLRTHKRESALRERQIRAMREKMPEMESSIEDLDKCTAVLVQHIEGLTAHIAAMVTSLESLEITIASEESALQELKGQLQQVQEFGDNSSHKYNQFLSSTADQLQASQDQLSQLLSHNRHLANCYTQQQKVCLRQKAQAVAILDASADDEATNQDYNQLLCVQGRSTVAAKECQKRWLKWAVSSIDSHKSRHQMSLRRIRAISERLQSSVAASQDYLHSELAANPLLYPMAS